MRTCTKANSTSVAVLKRERMSKSKLLLQTPKTVRLASVAWDKSAGKVQERGIEVIQLSSQKEVFLPSMVSSRFVASRSLGPGRKMDPRPFDFMSFGV